MKRKKGNLTTVLLVFVLLAGLSLLLYPTVSDYWNSFTQSKAIAGYAEQVSNLDQEKYDQLWQAAQSYNQALASGSGGYSLDEAQKADYESLLNLSGTGVMGYVEIPRISCTLPIYHGTEASVLQIATGHLEWTSLPVGGESSHCVISGHRGLPSAKLFTNLDQLLEGDLFMLRTLDEVLTYEVDQILTVEPQEVEALRIAEGKDYCTLVTCTPYGINSHRLLVRGHRVDNIEEARTVRVTAEAMQIEPLLVAPILAAPLLLVLLVGLMLPKPKKKIDRGDFTDESVDEKNRAVWLASLLAALALLMPPAAQAAGMVDLDQEAFLNISFHDQDTPLAGARIDIYLVARMDESGALTVTEEFAPYFELYNLTIDMESWKTLATTLQGLILLDGLRPTDSGVTGPNGYLSFPNQRESLEKGLYLVMGQTHIQDGRVYKTTPFMVTAPEMVQVVEGGGAFWSYDVDVVMKFSSRVDSNDSGTVDRKVLKVWADSGHESQCPQEITVHLLQDGKIYDTVTLNADTNWRYSWQELDKGAEWAVVEAGGGGYTVSISQQGITFVVTNTYRGDNPPPEEPDNPDNSDNPPPEGPPDEDVPDNPPPTSWHEPPPDESQPGEPQPTEELEEIPPDDIPLSNLPQTGQLWWPAPILLSAGLLLIILGLLRRRGGLYEE